MVIPGAVDITGVGTHLVEQTGGKCGGKGVRNQSRGGHPIATSVFTQYAIHLSVTVNPLGSRGHLVEIPPLSSLPELYYIAKLAVL